MAYTRWFNQMLWRDWSMLSLKMSGDDFGRRTFICIILDNFAQAAVREGEDKEAQHQFVC